MPPPHKQSPSRPAQFFGIGGVPANEYFAPPRKGYLDPSFSPIARESMMIEEEQSRVRDRTARAWDAEDKANEFIDQAPGRESDALMDQLTPELLMAPQGAAISNFMKMKQDAEDRRLRFSNASLAPSLAMKIKDPRLRQFYMDKITAGGAALDVFQEVEEMSFDQEQMMKLAEAGVSDEEAAALRGPDGRLDPVAVARRAAMKAAKDTVKPLSQEEFDKVLEGLPTDPAKRAAYLDLRETATGQDLSALRSVEEGMLLPKVRALDVSQMKTLDDQLFEAEGDAVKTQQILDRYAAANYDMTPYGGKRGRVPLAPTAPSTEALPPPDGTIPPPPVIPPEEVESPFEYLDRKAKAKIPPPPDPVQQEIDTAWTQAKQDIGKRIEDQFKQESPAETKEVLKRAAQSILTGKKMSANLGIGFANDKMLEKVPVAYHILYTLGINPDEPAFQEPANKRFGSQKVAWDEVMKAWAQDYLTGIDNVEKRQRDADLKAGKPVEVQKITIEKLPD